MGDGREQQEQGNGRPDAQRADGFRTGAIIGGVPAWKLRYEVVIGSEKLLLMANIRVAMIRWSRPITALSRRRFL